MAEQSLPASTDNASAVVIGGANIDHKSQTLAAPVLGTSNPGHSRTSSGGVGRNVADNLARMGIRTTLITAIGVDADGDRLARETAGAGVDMGHAVRTSVPTGRYTAVLDDRGDMIVAVSAMEAIDEVSIDVVDGCAGLIASADILVLDCNIPEAALMRAAVLARASDVRIVIDPVSTPKASRLRTLLSARIPVHTITPNREELHTLTGFQGESAGDIPGAATFLHRTGVQHVWVRLGSDGSYFSSMEKGRERAETIAPYPSILVDATGAGDAMLAAYVAGLLKGLDPFAAARLGSAAAAITIESPLTVNPSISFAALAARVASS